MSSSCELAPLPATERLSPLVWRVLGGNAGAYTLQGTNTYLVGSGPSRLLIDTGEANKPAYIAALQQVLAETGASIGTIVCTHWHADHVGGAGDVIKQVVQSDSTRVHKRQRPDKPDATGLNYEWIEDEHKFEVEGATVSVIYTPGHTTDHISLWLHEEQALFSGDCVLGQGTAVFEDLHDLMNSLDRLLKRKPGRIYPGHGPVIEDGCAHIAGYIAHRTNRERQIMDYLRSQNGYACFLLTIVQAVYGWLSPPLFIGAANNVNNHLQKLLKEEKVEKCALERWKIKV